MQLVSREHIAIASDVWSGKPHFAGTRIAVENVAVIHLKLGYFLVGLPITPQQNLYVVVLWDDENQELYLL